MKAASGPSGGATTVLALNVVPLDTSSYLKLACLDRAGSMFASLIARSSKSELTRLWPRLTSGGQAAYPGSIETEALAR